VREGRPYPPANVAEVVRLPGVEDACRRLAAAGWLLIVVTNQPDIARGSVRREDVDAINAVVTAGLPVADVLVCPHDDQDRCDCRKPKPGMLIAAAARHGIDLAACVMVGDRWRDIAAGHEAGARTIFLDRGYAEELPTPADHVASTISEAADIILSESKPG
jgi:D-glycero-D-manno-heptose 1,7-bisphosphate phosphatase